MAVDTHPHGDHTGGNRLLPESAAVVAHQATRDGPLADFVLADTADLGAGAELGRGQCPATERRAARSADRVRRRSAGGVAPSGAHVRRRGGRLPEDRVLFTGDLIFTELRHWW